MSGRPEAPRPGPGRPKLEADEKRQSLTIRLPPDVVAYLDTQGRRKGRVIEEALRQRMRQETTLTSRPKL